VRSVSVARLITIVVVFLAAGASGAAAQQTRDEQRAAEQEKKAADLHPYVPTPLEQRIDRVSGILTNQPPVYVFIGGVYRGGAIALGPGFRHESSFGFFDTHAAWSIKNYKRVDASLRLPTFADGRVTIDTHANWLDAPKVTFYGTGPDSPQDARTSYRFQAGVAGVTGRVRLARLLNVGSTPDYVDIDTRAGQSGTSIEERFSAFSAPGLNLDPTYLRTQSYAAIDSRQSPGYTTRGSLLRVDWSTCHQREDGPLSFERLDAEVNQFVPVLHANWVFAFRALVSATTTDEGDRVPYFLMPDLGGSHTLRGYSTWRFRDRNRMLVTGEYRWTAGPLVDMALFMDAGKVASRIADMNFSGLKTSQGVDLTIHTPNATLTRIEFAHSREGLSIGFSFSPSF